VPTVHVPVLFSIRAHDYSRFLYLRRTRSSLVFVPAPSNQKTTCVATIVCMALLVTVQPRHVLQTPSPRVHLAFHDSLISHIWEARSIGHKEKQLHDFHAWPINALFQERAGSRTVADEFAVACSTIMR
jgi:hypothetical protein